MRCEKCGAATTEQEAHNHAGQTLCDDCYMDALSPTRTCDPWAVHAAKGLEKSDGPVCLTPRQERLLGILKQTGGIAPGNLAAELGIEIKELERDIAALRHMEKLRGEMRDGVKLIVLW